VNAPLATYTAAGFSCSAGPLDFSSFVVLPGPAFAAEFPALSINPVTASPIEFGLEFVVNQSASLGEVFEQLIGYRVTGLGMSINRNTLFFTGSSTTDDAVVSALEQKCLAGAFSGPDGVTGCTGSALDQAVINILGIADPPISADFAPVAFLSVVSDIAVDAGALGTAALTSATNLFRVTAAPAQVAEPSSAMLATLAALLLFLVGRRMTLVPMLASSRPLTAAVPLAPGSH
jgi:hypothetical protein